MSGERGQAEPFRLPIFATAAALVALAVLWYSMAGSPALLLLAAGLIGPYFTSARMSSGWWVPWAFRIVAFTTVAAVVTSTPTSAYDGVIDPRASSLFAHLCAAELVVQVWRQDSAMGTRGVGAILLSGLILAAAGNTFTHIGMAIGGPLFVLLLVLALPGFYPGRSLRPFGRAMSLTLLLLVPAMAIGGASHYFLRVHRQDLTEWSNRLLKPLGGAAMSGFGAAPMLSDSYDLQLSPVRVLRITGLEGITYLRGASFDYYSGGRWSPSLADELFSDLTPGILAPRAPGIRADVSRLRNDFNLLFVPLHASGIEPAPESTLLWAPEQGYALRAYRRDLNPYTYSFTLTNDDEHQGPLCQPLSAPQRTRLLTVPDGVREELGPIAESVGGGASTPTEKIKAVEQFLLSNNSYSLRVRRGRGDPVVAFLREKRAAHCQYFAASSALLLRVLGVPARYASGYLAHETDEKGRVIVRQRDAHAWTEAYVDGKGWVTVDATPGDGRPNELWGEIPAWLSAWEWLQDHLAGLRDWISDRSNYDVRTLLLIGPGIAGLIFAAHLLRRRRKPQLSSGYTLPAPEWSALTERFSALLERQGAPCPPGLPWSEHLHHLSSGAPDEEETKKVPPALLDEAKRFAAEYNRVRFGAPEDVEALRGLARRLDEMLSRR